MGLEQGTLEQGTWGTYKENYFKINASPGSGGGSVKGSALGRREVPLVEGKCPRLLQQEDDWREPRVKW